MDSLNDGVEDRRKENFIIHKPALMSSSTIPSFIDVYNFKDFVTNGLQAQKSTTKTREDD